MWSSRVCVQQFKPVENRLCSSRYRPFTDRASTPYFNWQFVDRRNFTTGQFDIEVDTVLCTIKTSNIIICDDILEKSRASDEYLSKMAIYGLRSLINEPTRVTTNSALCIDRVFLRRNIKCDIKSEHCVIVQQECLITG